MAYTQPRLDPETAQIQCEIGARLRQARIDAGMSVYKVGDVGLPGLKRSIISAYERGERPITAARLVRLARLYGVSAGSLLPDWSNR